MDDEYFMRKALDEAFLARDEGEVPIGAVIVCKNKIIARGRNTVERLHDSTSHAEILAITSAEEMLGSKYLKDCTIYVTIEPCLMCYGAIALSHIERIVYGAKDEKYGYSNFISFRENKVAEYLNKAPLYSNKVALRYNKMTVLSGVLKSECVKVMKDFFKTKR